MGRVVDVLETEIKLTDKYTATAKKITNATKEMADASREIPILGSAMGSSFSRIGSIVSSLSNPYGIAIISVAAINAASSMTALAGAIEGLKPVLLDVGPLAANLFAFKITQPAIQAAMAIDTVKRQFTAMLGSAREGENALRWLQKYGLTSATTQAPLAEAMRTLLRQGLSPSRYLPIMETLAMGGGKSLDESMMDMASIFRRMAGGQIAEAFGPEGLGRFGIGRNDLMQYGARFDSQNRFLGTMQDALDVLERMATLDPKIKSLKKEMETSISTQVSNMQDAWELALGALGESVASQILPPLTEAATALGEIAKSGVINDIAKSFGELFSAVGSGNMTEAVYDLVASIKVGVYMLMMLKEGISQFIADVVSTARNIPIIGDVLSRPYELGKGIGSWISGWIDMEKKSIKEAVDKAKTENNVWDPVPEARTETVTEKLDTTNERLAGIERNTGRLIQIQRMIIGGSGAGSVGVTPIEMTSIRSRRGTPEQELAETIRRYIGYEIAKLNGWATAR